MKRWEDNIVKVPKLKAPAIIYEETARTVALLRDIFNPSFQNIYVNDKEVYNNVRDYVSLIAPGREEIVIYGRASYLRQLCGHQANQVAIRTNCHLQEWSLLDYRAHGSYARYRREQREPFQRQRCPREDSYRRKYSRRR